MIAALEAAVQGTPQDADLRLHLAGLLLGAGRADEALTHATTVLASRPDHVPALRTAGAAARAAGDEARAAAYDRLADALETAEGVPNPTPGRGGQPDPAASRGSVTDTDPAGAGAQAPGRPADPSEPAPSPRPAADPPTPAPMMAVPDTADELLAGWTDQDAPQEPEIGELRAPDVTLADVGGLAEVKRRLELSFLGPMRNPELRAQFGKSLRGGLLLWGPPGCGKTFIARALAGELGANFYVVGLSDVLDMYLGNSERNLHAIFETARRNRPCVLFFDEVDAIGQKRSQMRGGGMRGVVNQMLSELDGASSDNDGLFVLGATNHPWDVDSALLRPGRFDRMVLVVPPDQEARETILRTHLRGRPAATLDYPKLAAATDGFSGADLALVCEQATEQALSASMAGGRVVPITERDLGQAIRSVRPSIGEWLETAKNYAQFSNDAGTYDDLLPYLKGRRKRWGGGG